MAILLFQSSTLLIENYSQNQCHYYRQKQKRLFSSYIESPIFNTNSNNIKLQMLQEGKQLEEKIQSI